MLDHYLTCTNMDQHVAYTLREISTRTNRSNFSIKADIACTAQTVCEELCYAYTHYHGTYGVNWPMHLVKLACV